MRVNILLSGVIFLLGLNIQAQDIYTDSLNRNLIIEEIFITQDYQPLHQKQAKSLATLDEFLEESPKVCMIKRGGYAWEPFINGMATERTLITIDGMRIFGACTDKMDPITSYVEVSNLSKAQVNSGQQGNIHGATIGGGLDLKRYSIREQKFGYKGKLISGYETNNHQKIIGASLGYNGKTFYAQSDFSHRDAENYKAGNQTEVPYSQFTKSNFSTTIGYVPNAKNLIEGSVIYDRATDVGYPALPMDVSLAKALITSFKYEYKPNLPWLSLWETKGYYNTITHIMDDTQRPSVPIHMDMPGWSDTYGMYSIFKGAYGNHTFMMNLNGFYNRSKAEMTMYPNDPGENLMFMFTWPDIHTTYGGLSAKETYTLNEVQDLKFTIGLGVHNNYVGDDLGLSSLKIFYPDMERSKNRFLKSMSVNYVFYGEGITYDFGMAYGERAPSVSEGYGFYLFNSNDRYDYIGNPELKNEKSMEGNFMLSYCHDNFHLKWSGTYFYLTDYIIGQPDDSLLPMTIGAVGVKRYQALEHAVLLNSDLQLEQYFMTDFKADLQLTYSYGKGLDGYYLPFIRPFGYKASVKYSKEHFTTTVLVKGNTSHNRYSGHYGEQYKADYAVLDWNVGYAFAWDRYTLDLQFGIENVFDAYYTTFADWNNIPRVGRNIFLGLEFNL